MVYPGDFAPPATARGNPQVPAVHYAAATQDAATWRTDPSAVATQKPSPGVEANFVPQVKMSEGMRVIMKDVDSGRDVERDGSPSQPKRGAPLLYMPYRRADATQVLAESSACAAWVSPSQRKPMSGNNAEVYHTSAVNVAGSGLSCLGVADS